MIITPEAIQHTIAQVELNYMRGTSTVVCCLVLTNGHVVVGEAHCAPGTDFNWQAGAEAARKDAERKVYPLLACAMRGPLAVVTTH